MKKQLKFLFVAFLLLTAGVIAHTVQANTTNSSNVYAVYNNGTLTFIQTTYTPTLNKDNISVKSTSGNTYTGRIYKADGSWSSLNSQIKTVNLTTKVAPLSTNNWFSGCTNLTSVNNAQLFDMSNNTNMSWMFQDCSNLSNLDVSNWDTSKVTDMSILFQGCSNLSNLDVSKWNTGNVTNMVGMFQNCSSLTRVGDLSNWNTSKVTNMSAMFQNCSSLASAGNLSKWNTSQVTDMSWMFDGCSKLTNLDVSNWDTSKVTDMGLMFQNCQNLSNLDVLKWNTGKVTDMTGIFQGCSSLARVGDLSKWDTSQVTSMGGMFQGCSNLSSVGNLSNWDTSQVTNMNWMFDSCSNLSSVGNLSNWNTSQVTNMNGMFNGCSKLTNLDVSNWNTSKVTDMSLMFNNCQNLSNLDVSKWNTSQGTDMPWMFSGCSSLTNLDLSKWNTGNVTNMSGMFDGCSSLARVGDLSNWDTSQVTDISLLFYGCSGLTNLDVSNWDTGKVTNSDDMFSGTTKLQSLTLGPKFNINSTNTGLTDNFDQRDPSFYPKWVRTSDDMFKSSNDLMTMDASVRVGTWEAKKTHVYAVYSNGSLTFIQTTATPTLNTDNISVKSTNGNTYTGRIYEADGSWSSLNSQIKTVNLTTKVTPLSTHNWFYGCTNLTSVNNAQLFDMSNNTDMSWMFGVDSNLTNLDVSKWDTSKVTDMNGTFINCSSFSNLDVSNWDTSKVTNMHNMFNGCLSLANLDVSKWDTSKVIEMTGMFANCTSLTNLDVSKWDTGNATYMGWMFQNCPKLTNLDVSKWDTGNATYMGWMFAGCPKLTNLDVSKWDTSNVTNMSWMFQNCSSLTKLDMSNWDTSKVTNSDNMFAGTTKLESLTLGSKFNINSTNTGLTDNFDQRDPSLYPKWVRTSDDMIKSSNDLMTTDASARVGTWLAKKSNVYAVYNNGTLTFIQATDTPTLNTDNISVKSTNGNTYTGRIYEADGSWSSLNSQIKIVDLTTKVTPLSTNGWFDGCTNLTSVNNAQLFDMLNNTDMADMFNGCSNLASLDVSKWDTSNVTDMRDVFSNCESLTSLDVSNWNTSKVTRMNGMFNSCYKFTNLDVSNWDTSNVKDMDYMFEYCTRLTSLDVSKWNTSNVTTMEGTFRWCLNLASLDVSKWDTSNVTTMEGTFSVCEALTNLDVSNWDTSKVTTMEGTFDDCRALTNLDVSKWATSNVTTMEGTFEDCYNLTSLDLSKWDTSNVTTMYGTFFDCRNLVNLDVSKLNTSSVTNMSSTFDGCSSLINLDVSKWDTSKVTTMARTFRGGAKLTSLDVSNWNTSKVTNMGETFASCSALTNLDVSNWDTSKVTNSDNMFTGTTKLQSLTLGSKFNINSTNTGLTDNFDQRDPSLYSKWVRTSDDMIKSSNDLMTMDASKRVGTWVAKKMTATINIIDSNKKTVLASAAMDNYKTIVDEWSHRGYTAGTSDVPPVLDPYAPSYKMTYTVYMNPNPHVYAVYNNGTLTFIQTTDTPTLNTDNTSVKSTNGNTYTGRIYEADGSWSSLNSQIKTVDLITKVTPLSTNSWFAGCTNLTSVNNAQLFDMSNNTDMTDMFAHCGSLTKITGIENWDVSHVKSFYEFLFDCSSIGSMDLSKWDVSSATNMFRMFSMYGSALNYALTSLGDLSNWDVSHVTDFGGFVEQDASLVNLNVSKWDTSKATDMVAMFANCSSLTNLDVSKWDTSQVTNMRAMFYGCSSLSNLDVSNWNTSKVTDMNWMFQNCQNLTNLDVSKWDTSHVTGMSWMFNGCSKLTNLDVSKWDTGKVTNMNNMFNGCSSLSNLNVSKWDTGKVTDMGSMFANCPKLTNLDVSKWDTDKSTTMNGMFNGCSSLTNLDVSKWDTSNVTDMSDIFAHCGSLTKITGIENWDVSHVKSFYEFLFDCSSIGNIDLSKWDVSSATNMFRMFSMYGSASNYTLTSLGDLSNWDVSHVTDFGGFVEKDASLVNLNVSKWDTSKATNMISMFNGCSSLVNLDVSKWDTSNVTNMRLMFYDCSSLTNLDVSSWDTSKVTISDNMFSRTTKLQSLTLGSKFNINSTNTGLTDDFNQRDPSLYSKWVRTSDDMVKSSNDLMTMDASARVGTWTAKKMIATIDITDSNRNTVLESGTLDNYKTIVDKWAHRGYTVGTSNVPSALDPYAPSYKMTYTVYMNPNVSTYSVTTTTPKGTYMFKDGKQVGTKTVNLTIIMNGGAYFTSNKMSDVINQVMSQTPAGWNVESTKYTITDGYGNNQTTPQGGYTVVYSVEFAVDQDKVTKSYGEFDPVLPTDHDSYDAISGGSIKITLPDVYTVTSLATRTSPVQDTVYAFYKLTGVRTGNNSTLGNLTFTDGKTGGYELLDGESAGNYVMAHMPIDWSNANNAGSYKWYESHMSFEYVNNYDNPDMAVVDTDDHMFDVTWYKHNPILFDDTNPSEQQVPYCQLNILGNDNKSFDTITLYNTYNFLQNSGDYLTAKAGYGIEYPYQVMQQFYDESSNATNKEPSGYATTSNLYDNTLTSDINHEELRFYTSSKQLDDVPANTSNEFAQLNAQYGSVFYPMQFQTLTNIEARSKLLRNGFQTYADEGYDNKSSFNSPSSVVSSMMLGNNQYDPDHRHCDYIKDNVKEGIYPLNINANIGEVTVNKNFKIQIYGSRMASKGSSDGSDGSDGEISIDGTLSGTTRNTTDNLKNQNGITDEEAEQLKDFLKN